ncbi:hypothetical protein SKAU_G00213500 [Synaphobranchus kaupii]|uniref:RIM zinc finger domain-containing protein n=1 Tax=Synaphobranchus kaupii TaxID=118154 RepID=A0A9Q1F9E1_SYNKA|nr:hypothetical protein SKAU_G00213500 [Synaphobranchus kaupii]
MDVWKRKLHQQFEMYKEQVKKMGEESQLTQELKGEAPTCGICHKTKFADGCGHVCSYCQTKFCARCGGRVSLRSNKEHCDRGGTRGHVVTVHPLLRVSSGCLNVKAAGFTACRGACPLARLG